MRFLIMINMYIYIVLYYNLSISTYLFYTGHNMLLLI